MSRTEPALSLEGVQVVRHARMILDISSLHIHRGEFLAVIGSNGAGKTTLLKTCSGLIRPQTGTVCLDGRSWQEVSAWRSATLRTRISTIPQRAEYHHELPFTVREVVTMGRAAIRGLLHGLDLQDRACVDHWLDRLDLTERQNQTFRSLSGGEQQKVLIARAMVQEPQILMLDEPCANLDFGWKCRITDLIEDLYEQGGLTVVLVCHEMSLIPRCCTRLILIHQGRILADDTPAQVLDRGDLSRVYGCRIEKVDVQGRTCVIGYGEET